MQENLVFGLHTVRPEFSWGKREIPVGGVSCAAIPRWSGLLQTIASESLAASYMYQTHFAF